MRDSPEFSREQIQKGNEVVSYLNSLPADAPEPEDETAIGRVFGSQVIPKEDFDAFVRRRLEEGSLGSITGPLSSDDENFLVEVAAKINTEVSAQLRKASFDKRDAIETKAVEQKPVLLGAIVTNYLQVK
jgi:hypothetical protein